MREARRARASRYRRSLLDRWLHPLLGDPRVQVLLQEPDVLPGPDVRETPTSHRFVDPARANTEIGRGLLDVPEAGVG